MNKRALTASGHYAGIQSAKDFGSKQREIIDQEKASRLRGENEDTTQGRNAKTVYRNKDGQQIDKEAEIIKEKSIAEEKKRKLEQAQSEWSKASVQRKELEDRKIELDIIAKGPFARREDDPQLEAMRKEKFEKEILWQGIYIERQINIEIVSVLHKKTKELIV